MPDINVHIHTDENGDAVRTSPKKVVGNGPHEKRKASIALTMAKFNKKKGRPKC